MRWWAVGVDQRRGMGTVKFKYSKKNKDKDGKVNMKKCPKANAGSNTPFAHRKRRPRSDVAIIEEAVHIQLSAHTRITQSNFRKQQQQKCQIII
jgi:hypothetical protein